MPCQRSMSEKIYDDEWKDSILSKISKQKRERHDIVEHKT
jgi:hypothetical protein